MQKQVQLASTQSQASNKNKLNLKSNTNTTKHDKFYPKSRLVLLNLGLAQRSAFMEFKLYIIRDINAQRRAKYALRHEMFL